MHFFNSFLFKKLTELIDSGEKVESIRKWTKKMDLFKMQYAFVPVVQGYVLPLYFFNYTWTVHWE
jgi:Ulp1 family protease